MSVSRIANRYAKSIVDLAVEQNKLDRIKTDMDQFKAAIENRDFLLMLKSPIIKSDKKQQVFKAIFGKSFDPMTMTFLDIVLRKNRESNLPEIADAFMDQYQTINQISTITVTTATPLTEEGMGQIKARLLESSETSKNINIISQIDPAIIGGFVVEFDNKLYDASVAHQLELLKKEFTN